MNLALSACRNRQSPRTGFVHFFPTNDQVRDTIPIFENFCFALALFRQKTAETALEGKELLERLLAFQSADGNFPIYLHDFPRCWDRWMPLKIAPVLLHILKQFRSYLPVEKMERALQKIYVYMEALGPLESMWEMRRKAIRGERGDFEPRTAEEWFEWLISRQLLEEKPQVAIPYSKKLQVFLGEHDVQEGGEPQPTALEWLLAEGEFGKRLLKDHPYQMHAALLFPVDLLSSEESSVVFLPGKIFWGGSQIHSLLLPRLQLTEPPKEEMEVALYCNLSSETEIFINGKKGSVFRLGDTISIQTPSVRIDFAFSILEGEGEFVGHISRANRPGQIRGKDHEVYDWQIGLRTLRRSTPCTLTLNRFFSASSAPLLREAPLR